MWFQNRRAKWRKSERFQSQLDKVEPRLASEVQSRDTDDVMQPAGDERETPYSDNTDTAREAQPEGPAQTDDQSDVTVANADTSAQAQPETRKSESPMDDIATPPADAPRSPQTDVRPHEPPQIAHCPVADDRTHTAPSTQQNLPIPLASPVQLPPLAGRPLFSHSASLFMSTMAASSNGASFLGLGARTRPHLTSSFD